MPIPTALPYPARSTPVPNLLIDEWMPCLSDTELRVLLVITRQTLGFQAGSKNTSTFRRARDWITHSQLKAKTGRASAAVSGAVDRLVKKGLLQVGTADGTPLLTSHERRRYRDKMFFSLMPRLLVKP